MISSFLSPGGQPWEYYMRQALFWARMAWTVDEVPIGAIIINQSGVVIGSGYNAPIAFCDPSAHAEINALRNAGKSIKNYRLCGCFLVCTIEPCIMCLGAIVQARLAGVVYGAADPKAGAICSCVARSSLSFLNHNFNYYGGVLETDCRQLLQFFFRKRRTKHMEIRSI